MISNCFETFVLGAESRLVALIRVLVAAATVATENHGESAAIARGRTIRFGAVDRFAVVGQEIAGSQVHGHFPRRIIGAVVGNAL